ncbi:MAG: hypothetical protein JWN11_1080 [Hyphomicrobiales bacterium]|nr:hypothetical protein [Hyphomicrobiales bacterium]
MQLIRTRIRKFVQARDAVAAIEFALVVPILITLYLGSIELSQLITVDRRVQTANGTVGDLVSQRKGSITCAQLGQYFQASQAILAELPTTTLKQTVTEVSVDAAGVGTVLWSQAGPNGGTTQITNQTYNLDPGMAGISQSSFVIVSESWYPYKPLLGLFFTSDIPLYRKNYFVSRYAANIAYQCP